MSHILLKKVQDNLVSAPASNYVKFFSNDSDGGLLYYMNSSGVATPIGDGTYNPVIDTTYSNLYSLYSSNGFATGSYYYINDFQTIYEQPDFYFDDKPKTVLSLTSSTSYPIVVLATSKNTLAIDAYQPDFPKDEIKYDFTWNETEFGNPAKGRITERIDTDGNRTDYDHRTIKFKRYQNYERDTLPLNGVITSWDCITGTVSGSATTFMSDISIGNIIILDSHSVWGGDENYTIGLKVKTKVSDTIITVEVDSLYTGGVPSTVLLNNVSQIIPTDYSFSAPPSLFHQFYLAIPTGDYTSYKEVYFGQYDDDDFDELYTFQLGGTSVNNYIGNYSQKYLSTSYNNTLILSNNVFTHTSSSYNKLEGTCYNNHFEGNALNNKISNDFNNNIIIGDFNNNIINGSFYNNFIGDMSNNSFYGEFYHNFTDMSSIFRNNFVKCEVGYFGLLFPIVTSPTHIYGTYSCDIILTSGLDVKLSYYNGSNALTVVDITS
jgi:hypothetical protein